MQRGGGRTLAAVLFTDMVDSTAIAEELGDRRWKALVDAHHRIVRRELKRFGGTELDTAGDGFFASFKEPASAIACACAATEAIRELGVEIRAGVHFGECERIGKKLGGITVVVGARIMALGGAGEVLISSTAAELTRGAGFGFEDRGMRTLKGVEGDWRVFAATAVDGAPRHAPLDAAQARTRREELDATPERRPHRTAVLIAGVVAISIIAAVIAVPRLRDVGDTTLVPDSVGVLDRASGRLLATVPVGSRPSAVVASDDSIWVANAASNNVTRIDRSSRRVIDTIPVGRDPEALVVANDAVWVANADDGTVSRIDPETSTVEVIQVGGGPLAITATDAGVWVANSIDNTVQRIDPDTLAAGEPIRVGGRPHAMASDGATIWVANQTDGTVATIDAPTESVVETVRVGTDPSDIAATDESTWVTNQGDGTVSIIAPDATHGPTTTAVGIDLNAVAASTTDRWVASGSDGALWQLAPDGGVTRTIGVGAAPTDIAIVDDELWVAAVANSRGAHRGGTLRLLADAVNKPERMTIDPAWAFNAPSWALLTITNDGLVGYRKAGGAAGSDLVPDLATSLPVPTEGGLTYTFQLRPGIRYSDGTAVTPVDFRRAIERAIAGEASVAPIYASIVGVPACVRASSDCDLTEGIEANESAGTVTFHLSTRDPELLYKLALPFAYSVPPTTPDRTRHEVQELTTSLPATGPYMITSYSWNDHVTLERNPLFREWSSAAQPDGFPDRIDVTAWTDPDDMVTDIERGEADAAMPGDGAIFPQDRVNEVATRFTSQTHVTPELNSTLFALNTQEPPFDDRRVRRALNYAVDRDVFVDIWGGKIVARVACQILPPNVPGYRRYCPYTLEPSSSGIWTAPDLRTANRLVEASGTRGMPITISTFDGFADPGAATGKYLAGVLEKLGYRVKMLNWGSDYDGHFRAFGDSSNRIAAGVWYWVPDYISVPSNYIVELLSCGAYSPNDPFNMNVAGFCDRRLDAEMLRARSLLAEDPSAGVQLWGEIDRKITDLAPWVPLVIQQRVEIVSPRVGNYQRNPQWGTLIDQLWVV